MSFLQWFRNLLLQLLAVLRGEHLTIRLGKKTMQTIKCNVAAKGKGAVMPQVKLSEVIAAGGLILQLVDAAGKPVIVDPNAVTGAMTTDNSSVTVTQGVDSLHDTLAFPPDLASSGSVVTDSATVTFNAGAPGPFSASLPILCDLTPPLPLAVDLQIILG